MDKQWKIMDFADCDRCGNLAEVFTQSKQDGYFYDDEESRCIECGLMGHTSVDEDDEGNGIISIQWDDFEESEEANG